MAFVEEGFATATAIAGRVGRWEGGSEQRKGGCEDTGYPHVQCLLRKLEEVSNVRDDPGTWVDILGSGPSTCGSDFNCHEALIAVSMQPKHVLEALVEYSGLMTAVAVVSATPN